MRKAKKVLGDRFCIRGCIPIHVMSFGTPDDVRKVAKEQIDILGEGGGYIMDINVEAEQIKPENMRALMEFTREYGVYR